jgi:nucleotide-binding universal stress UspA family protein
VTRPGPLGVLVAHDGSRRSDQTLADAVELCRGSRARLGLALIQPWVYTVQAAWVCIVMPPSWERVDCDRLLHRLPSDVSVKFLSSPHPAGVSEIAEFARRLDCDSVLLPYSGWRARRAARVLARHGIEVLVDVPNGHP